MPEAEAGGTGLSVVVPVYRCGDSAPALHDRLSRVLGATGLAYEIVFVDDADPDGAWATLERLARDDPRVVAVRLRQNVGQHAAIAAGLRRARGARAVVLDGDLEDPPEILPAFLERASGGFDVVVGVRRTLGGGAWRQAAGNGFRALFRLLRGRALPAGYSMYTVLSRPAVDRFLAHPACGRVFAVALTDLGLPWTTLAYAREPRPRGRSAYTVGRLARLALVALLAPRASARRAPLIADVERVVGGGARCGTS